MTFDIPPGATVQIFIGAPHVAVAAVPASGEPPILTSPAPSPRGRPLLKLAGVGLLVTAAFLGGQAVHPGFRPSLAAVGAATSAPAHASTAPQDYGHARPERPPPFQANVPPTAPGTQIPPAFAQQLQQPPTITPPPGAKPSPPAQTAAGTPATHPFGLED